MCDGILASSDFDEVSISSNLRLQFYKNITVNYFLKNIPHYYKLDVV